MILEIQRALRFLDDIWYTRAKLSRETVLYMYLYTLVYCVIHSIWQFVFVCEHMRVYVYMFVYVCVFARPVHTNATHTTIIRSRKLTVDQYTSRPVTAIYSFICLFLHSILRSVRDTLCSFRFTPSLRFFCTSQSVYKFSIGFSLSLGICSVFFLFFCFLYT